MANDAGAFADTIRSLTAAMVGGTVSEISGGKFANGAVTAAFAQSFNGNSAIERAVQRFKAFTHASSLRGSIFPQMGITCKAPGWLNVELKVGASLGSTVSGDNSELGYDGKIEGAAVLTVSGIVARRSRGARIQDAGRVL